MSKTGRVCPSLSISNRIWTGNADLHLLESVEEKEKEKKEEIEAEGIGETPATIQRVDYPDTEKTDIIAGKRNHLKETEHGEDRTTNIIKTPIITIEWSLKTSINEVTIDYPDAQCHQRDLQDL